MKLVNLTPHTVYIADEAGAIIRTIAPTIPAARVASKAVAGTPIDGVPYNETVFGAVDNLPAPNEETIYIVAQFVIQAALGRKDLVRPDTGPTCVRDADGKIVAVRALTR
jgi:hypothetical protein